MSQKTVALVLHYLKDDLTKAVINELSSCELAYTIVADDGSPDLFTSDSVLTFRSDENLGYIKSANQAMDRLANDSSIEYVWLLNNDINGITSDMLNALERELDTCTNLAAVSPAVYPSPHTSMYPNRRIARRFDKHIDFVCPLINVSAWKQIGPMDFNLKGFGCDLDWCKRARLLGWRLAVTPSFTINHQMGAASVGDPKGHNDMEFMNQYLCKKWNVKDWRDLRN